MINQKQRGMKPSLGVESRERTVWAAFNLSVQAIILNC